jgi:hypothetical protein
MELRQPTVETEADNICCVCTQRKVEKSKKISVNFLKVNSKYESLKAILIKELDLISYAVR